MINKTTIEEICYAIDKADGYFYDHIKNGLIENDIYKPADPRNVMYMKEYFPGTIISLKFYLDRNYIEQKKRG